LSTTAPQTWHTVTAIIVAHDGARLLPAAVQAIQAQTHQADRVVGVDTGSRDRSGAVLAELIGADAVVSLDRAAGFGEAVSAALRHADGRRPGPADPGLKRVEWIWLLHDDCEPAPESLERLLRAAGRDRSVAVLGPKVLDGQDRRTLREVGISIDRAGRRVTGIDPGEIDQGQHDHNTEVFAVGSAGMLVRRDVWDQLGGFDSRLRFFRDDLDFCWRVQGAGYRVQVATDAVLYHRELAARRRRPIEGGHARWLDRRNALFVLAVNLPLLTMLRVVGGCVVGTLVRGSYFLVTKQLDLAAAQVFALAGLFGHPIVFFHARRRRARGHGEAYDAARLYMPPAHTLFKLAEKISGLLSHGPPQASGGAHQAVSDEQREDEQFVDAPSVGRQIFGNPGVQLFAVLLLIALIAERRLLSIGPLGGGALVPAWGGAAALWREYLAGFHAVGIGSTASAPPYLAVVAALSTVLGGQAWLAVDLLLLGCVPLAGLTAYLAARRLVTSTAARLLLAASYALLPVATGSIAAGRLGTAVAFILLPVIALSAGRMLTAAPRQARRAAWAVGLLVGVAAAFAPLAWVLGVIFAVGALAARRWLVSVNPLNAAIVAAVPFFVLFPWSLHLLTSPSSLIAEAGVPTAGLAGSTLGPSALLALSPGGPGLPPAWVTIGFGLAVLAALLPHRGRALTVAGWIVAIVGFLTAVLVRSLSFTPPGDDQAVAGWPGFALALAALGLLLATAPAAQWLAEIVKNTSIIPNGPGRLSDLPPEPEPGYGPARRMLACGALIVAATAPLLVASYWVREGVQGPIASISAPLLPAFVSASSSSGEQYRTLILRPDGKTLASGALGAGGLDYMVVRQGDPTLGEPELDNAPAAEKVLSAEVAALAASAGADAGDPGLMLGEFGIRWVLLPGPVDPVLAQRLDAAMGLVALSKAPTYDLWQVAGPVARVRVVAADGTTTTLAAGSVDMSGARAPAGGGTLLLAEPYGGWAATLNGSALKPLAAPADGWAQGFVLPAGGGRLSITRNNLARDTSLIAELIAVLASCVLALPGKRADPAEEARAMEALREARPGQRAGQRAGKRAGQRAASTDAPAGARRRARAGDRGRAGLGLGAGLPGPYRAMTRRARLAELSPDRRRTGQRGTGPVAELDDAQFQDAELDDAQFQDAQFQDAQFQDAQFQDAQFQDAEAPDAEFREAAAFGEPVAADDVLAEASAPDSSAADGAVGHRWDTAGDWTSPAPWAAGLEPRSTWETPPPQPEPSETGSSKLEPWETGPRVFASSTGPEQSGPWPTGPQIPAQPDDQEPSAMPWDSAARDATAWDSVAQDSTSWGSGDWPATAQWPHDAVPASGPERDDTPEWHGTGEAPAWPGTGEAPAWPGTGEAAAWPGTGETAEWPVPARSGEPAPASRAAKPERHSHRAAKHGRPSRWRAGGDRSGRNGGS
jgi:GT2 family glycosyltransferase